MPSPRRKPPLLDPEHTAFVQSGVSIGAASRGEGNAPVLARAMGCRVSTDRRQVTLLFPVSQSRKFLEAVRATGAIAVVFSQPSTHRTIQLKGMDASIAAADPQDAALCARNTVGFTAELKLLGFREEFARTVLRFEPGELQAVSFTPTSAFTQTPGPRAGTPLYSTP